MRSNESFGTSSKEHVLFYKQLPSDERLLFCAMQKLSILSTLRESIFGILQIHSVKRLNFCCRHSKHLKLTIAPVRYISNALAKCNKDKVTDIGIADFEFLPLLMSTQV